MRVLHVITELDLAMGGPVHALQALVLAQTRIGIDVTVFPCRRTSGQQVLSPGIHGRLRVLHPVTRSSLKWFSPAVKRGMTLAAAGCDILHVHGIWRYQSRVAPLVARRTRTRLILRPYGSLGIVSRAHKGRIKTLYWRLFEKRVAESARRIHCASLKEEREIKTLGISTRTFVVPNPIDDTLLDVAPDEDALLKAVPAMDRFEHCLFFMGRISFIKNLPALVEAFSQVAGDAPSWHLVLAGNHEEPELVRRLKRMSAELGVGDRVCLPGMLVGGSKVAALRRADLFVQPSLHENFGVSAAEALLFGLPCVLADGVALAADVEAEDAGVQCGSGADSIAKALRQLMHDAEARERMVPNARRLADRFRPEVVARALEAEYRCCLNEDEA